MDPSLRHYARMARGRDLHQERRRQATPLGQNRWDSTGYCDEAADLDELEAHWSTDFRFARDDLNANEAEGYSIGQVGQLGVGFARCSPSRSFMLQASLEASRHACDTADAFAPHVSRSTSFLGMRHAGRQTWTATSSPTSVASSPSHGSSSSGGQHHGAWESWEAKWTRLLEAEADACGTQLVLVDNGRQRIEMNLRRNALAARLDREWKQRTAQEAQWRTMQEGLKRQSDGFVHSKHTRERWENEDSQWRKRHSEPQWREHTKSGKAEAEKPRGHAPLPPHSTGSRVQTEMSTERKFQTWEEYDAAWNDFEAHARKGATLRYRDIPWPNVAENGAAGLRPGSELADAKKRLFTALRRWHPDKWQSLLDQVAREDIQAVKTRIKEVTEKILSEKKRAGL